MSRQHNTLQPGDEVCGYLITEKSEQQQDPGTTYLCKHPYSQSTFQARVFPSHFTENSSFMKQLTGAIQEMPRLKHPFLLRIRTTGEAYGLPCLITEHFDAPTLASRLSAKQPLSGEFAHRILLQLIEVIEYLHKHKSPHGEIQPQHLRVTDDAQLRLDGLGLALLTQETPPTTEKDIHDFANTLTSLLPHIQPTAQWSTPTAPIDQWEAFAHKCQLSPTNKGYQNIFELQADLHKLGPAPAPISLKAALLVTAIFATLAAIFFLALDK